MAGNRPSRFLGTLIPLLLVRAVLAFLRELSHKEAQGNRQTEMRTDQVLRIFMSELFRHQCSPIPTLGSELLIAKDLLHELEPQIRCPPEIHSWFGQRCRKSKSW